MDNNITISVLESLRQRLKIEKEEIERKLYKELHTESYKTFLRGQMFGLILAESCIEEAMEACQD